MSEKINKKTGKTYRALLCRCDCGNECYCSKEKVLKGSKKSCGCLQSEMRQKLGEKRRLQYSEASANERYGAYKRGAARRGLDFALTKEQFMDISTRPCIYCGAEKTSIYRGNCNRKRNGEFVYTGIDRYDNNKGYTVENSVPCCPKCNKIKLDMDPDDMIEQLKKIIANEKR